ncbi:MAG TPA: OmpA family protein [bacterium]
MNRKYLAFLIILLCKPLIAEPLEKHGIIASYGVGDIPGFMENKITDPEAQGWLRYKGQDASLKYIYYGKGGYKGAFSGHYTLDWVRMTTFPTQREIEFVDIDRLAFNVTGIWTAFPGSPLNFYTGIGVGFSVLLPTAWILEEEPPGTFSRKEKISYPIPLLPIHIPFGINIRIKNLLLNVETGIRDIYPYLTGGVGFIFGKSDDIKIVKETIEVTPPPPDTGRITGRVLEKDTNTPLGKAVIEMKGTSLTDLSTNADGAFATPEIKTGEVNLVATKDGFAQGTAKVVVEQGKAAEVTILLQKEIAMGAIFGRIQDQENKPLPATISIKSALIEEKTDAGAIPSAVSDISTGEFIVKLPSGNYEVAVTMPNYKTQIKTATVKDGFKTRVDFTLESESAPPPPPSLPPAPEKKPRVFIEKQKIVITETIFFGSGKANILPVSYSLMDDISDILLKNQNIKIRIEGHTDSIGSDQPNLRLSDARANTIMKYLINKGVSPDRVTAKGYGETMPIADNATAEGRAKNRRVEFVITDQ